MSYINIHKAELEQGPGGAVVALTEDNQAHSLTDGEELMAAWKLLEELDALGEGEALVVWKDTF